MIWNVEIVWVQAPTLRLLSSNNSNKGKNSTVNQLQNNSTVQAATGSPQIEPPEPDDENDDSSGNNLSPKAKQELGNLSNRADEKVADVIRSRGGNTSNINRLQSDSGEKTLREVAEAAAKGDRNAKQIIKMIKQAKTKGQRY